MGRTAGITTTVEPDTSFAPEKLELDLIYALSQRNSPWYTTVSRRMISWWYGWYWMGPGCNWGHARGLTSVLQMFFMSLRSVKRQEVNGASFLSYLKRSLWILWVCLYANQVSVLNPYDVQRVNVTANNIFQGLLLVLNYDTPPLLQSRLNMTWRKGQVRGLQSRTLVSSQLDPVM